MKKLFAFLILLLFIAPCSADQFGGVSPTSLDTTLATFDTIALRNTALATFATVSTTSSITTTATMRAGSFEGTGGGTIVGTLTATNLNATNQIYVLAGGSLTSSNGGFTNVVFTSEAVDTHNSFDGRIFTAEAAGVYLVSWNLSTSTQTWAVGNTIFSILSKNDSTVDGGSWYSMLTNAPAIATTYFQMPGCAIVKLVAGDNLQIKYYANRTAGATPLGGGSNTSSNYLMIAKIS